MGKTQQDKTGDTNGTPGYVLVSIIFALMIFAIEGFKASLGLGEEGRIIGMVNLAFVALGLVLCFFWKRLHESQLKQSAALAFSVGLWAYQILLVGIPLVISAETAAQKAFFVQQFGFGAILVSALVLLAAVFYDATKASSLTLAAIAGLLTTLGSVSGLLPRSHSARDGHGREELSARSHSALDEGDGEEEEIHSSDFTNKGPAGAHEEDGADHHSDEESESHSDHDQDALTHEDQVPAPSQARKSAKPAGKHKKAAASNLKLAARSHEAHEDEAETLREAKASEKEKPGRGKTPKKLVHAGGAKVHWEYEGDRGPEAWGDLSRDFKLCSEGVEQSPIDISANWQLSHKLEVFYRPSGFELIDNGHTVQFNVEAGNFMKIGAARYELKQVHFHTPSEHFFNGRSSILEAHFVHASARGELAVLGSMIEPGVMHREYQKIWNFFPNKVNEVVKAKGKLFDPRALLPEDLAVYNYPGSLTTPPCSEKVNWNVLREPVQMSQDQINRFRAKYRFNARPIQPLNER